MLRSLALFFAACLVAAPVAAQNYADAVHARILPGWKMQNGTLMAGLELTLAPGWKTYWRAPGDAGIPPVFDWSESQNLRAVSVSWPTPHVFDQGGMRSVGYKNRVVLPLALTPRRAGQPVQLSARVDIGVCDDVCVPVRFKVSQAIPGTASRPDPEIAAALADRPFSASEAGLRAKACTVAPAEDGLTLHAEFTIPSTGADETAVVETGDPQVWASEPRIARHGSKLTAEFDLMHASGGPFALDRSALRFTILGQDRAVDIKGCTN